MFIWTISDAIGIAVLLIFCLAFGIAGLANLLDRVISKFHKTK